MHLKGERLEDKGRENTCFLKEENATRPSTVRERINTEKSEKVMKISFSAVRTEPCEHLCERPVPAPRALEKRKMKDKGKGGSTGKGPGEGGSVDKLPQKGGWK